MSDLLSTERIKLEKFFGMGSGYILDFSNRTFHEFILEVTGIDIYSDNYDYGSGSKANRLRAFWKKEPNYIVGQLSLDMLEHWRANKLTNFSEITPTEQALFEECQKICYRLKEDNIVENIDAIQPNTTDKDFALLAKQIRDNIQKNEPEVALDRLHTFVMKYVRQLCEKHGIKYGKSKALHSLFGEYVKHLRSNGIVKSEMTERILKSSISILESFNDVRNNQSFAHDNPILNYNESVLIFNNVSSAIRFIEAVEQEQARLRDVGAEWEDFTF